MPRYFYVVSFALIAAAMLGAVIWYNGRPSSYSECIVSEMRGQSSHMLREVSKVCAIRFRKEEELPISYVADGKVEFLLLPDFAKDPSVIMMGSTRFEKPPMVLTITKNDTEFEITRARMKHSFKFEVDCSRIPDTEWQDGPEAAFEGKVANVAMPAVYDKETKLHRPPFCYRYEKIWGMFRKE